MLSMVRDQAKGLGGTEVESSAFFGCLEYRPVKVRMDGVNHCFVVNFRRAGPSVQIIFVDA
jgi:hypothetical protein